jgi:hypothetical protein
MNAGPFLLAAWMLNPAALADANANQFDLNCTGSAKVYRDAKIVSEPFVQTLHIDLQKGEYCTDDCSEILKLHDVNSMKITLVYSNQKRSALSVYQNIRTIDRTTGNYKIGFLDSNNLKSLTVEALCKPAPFTPFPAAKF